jgi:hypothetical protein
MDLTRIWDELRRLWRRISEIDQAIARLPVREAKVRQASGSALRWGAVSTEITAATAWGTWGTGYYQEYDDAGATVGSPVAVDNWYPTVFAVDTVVCVDASFSPPRVVSASCEVMPE